VLFDSGRFDEAHEAFRKSISTNSEGYGSDNVLLWLAKTQHMQGRYSEAVMSYRKAELFWNLDPVERAAERLDGTRGLLLCLLHLQRFDDVRRFLDSLHDGVLSHAKLLCEVVAGSVSLGYSGVRLDGQLPPETVIWCLRWSLRYEVTASALDSLVGVYSHLGQGDEALRYAEWFSTRPALLEELAIERQNEIQEILSRQNGTKAEVRDWRELVELGVSREADGLFDEAESAYREALLRVAASERSSMWIPQEKLTRLLLLGGEFSQQEVALLSELDEPSVDQIAIDVILQARKLSVADDWKSASDLYLVIVQLLEFTKDWENNLVDTVEIHLDMTPNEFYKEIITGFFMAERDSVAESFIRQLPLSEGEKAAILLETCELHTAHEYSEMYGFKQMEFDACTRCLNLSIRYSSEYSNVCAKANHLRVGERFEAARLTYAELVERFPELTNEFDLREYADLLEVGGNLPKAEEWFRRAAFSWPAADNQSSWEELGEFYKRHGRVEEAERCFAVVRAVNELDANVRLVRDGEATAAAGGPESHVGKPLSAIEVGSDEEVERVMLQHGVHPHSLVDLGSTSPYETFGEFVEAGEAWLSPAGWHNAKSSSFLRGMWSRGYSWADPQYLFFDEFAVDEDFLDESLARAESLKHKFRMRPEFPIYLATPAVYIALDSAGLLVRAWVGNEQQGIAVSFDPENFDLYYRSGDTDAMFAMGAALNWFVDCVTVLDGPHFQRLGSFSTDKSFRETTANNWWTSNSNFEGHIRGVSDGTLSRPPSAHRVRGHIRRLNDMNPTDEARENAPAYIRRNMGPNDTFVRAHSRGGSEATDRLFERIKGGSSLADYFAMAPRLD